MNGSESFFQDDRWLKEHVRSILKHYHPQCLDDIYGGYIAQISDADGHIYDGRTKHIVSTCRYIYSFSVGQLIGGPSWCRSAAEIGLDFLENQFTDAENSGYYWRLSGTDIADSRKLCYGHAFVLLAYSTAANAGVGDAESRIERIYELIDEHFWEAEHGLCRIELDREWSPASNYRGQNSNMHLCEALIEAYRATGREKYIERALGIAEKLTYELSQKSDGLVWEHFTPQWEIDWDYNRGIQSNRFRPWGYQTGHQLEWSKLIAILAGYAEEDWMAPTAKRLFERSVEVAWDSQKGGLMYTFDRSGEVLLDEKYYWKISEGIGAAGLLAKWTRDPIYWEWYERFWEYAWEHMINRQNGNWYFKLTRDNEFNPDWERDVDAEADQTPIVKTDYHPINACREVLDYEV